jgi:hypothetical protein
MVRTMTNEDVYNYLLKQAMADYCENINDRIPGYELYDEENEEHVFEESAKMTKREYLKLCQQKLKESLDSLEKLNSSFSLSELETF